MSDATMLERTTPPAGDLSPPEWQPSRWTPPRGLEEAVDRLCSLLVAKKAPALASSMAGIDRRILALRAPAGEGTPWVILDPELEAVGASREEKMEDCLCLPGIRVRVPRSREVTLRGVSRTGVSLRFTAGGLLARAIQHQMDHLDGVLTVDRMSEEARRAIPSEILHPPTLCPS